MIRANLATRSAPTAPAICLDAGFQESGSTGAELSDMARFKPPSPPLHPGRVAISVWRCSRRRRRAGRLCLFGRDRAAAHSGSRALLLPSGLGVLRADRKILNQGAIGPERSSPFTCRRSMCLGNSRRSSSCARPTSSWRSNLDGSGRRACASQNVGKATANVISATLRPDPAYSGQHGISGAADRGCDYGDDRRAGGGRKIGGSAGFWRAKAPRDCAASPASRKAADSRHHHGAYRLRPCRRGFTRSRRLSFLARSAAAAVR